MSPLAKREKEQLLILARQTLTAKVVESRFEFQESPVPALNQPSGAFVTLHRGEELRGCIGRIRSEDPLYRVIQEMAVAAGTRDPRFPPVRGEELGQIQIEISVLSPPEILRSPQDLRVGEHGLIVSQGYQSGLLLPQVASECGWDAETFLSHTCMKAGLPPDFWRQPVAKIEIFSAEVFSERDFVA